MTALRGCPEQQAIKVCDELCVRSEGAMQKSCVESQNNYQRMRELRETERIAIWKSHENENENRLKSNQSKPN